MNVSIRIAGVLAGCTAAPVWLGVTLSAPAAADVDCSQEAVAN